MKSTVNIRRYHEADRDNVVSLWRRAFPNDPAHNEPSAVLAAKLAVDDLVFVAIDKDRIIGAAIAGYDGHRGWLYSVAVDQEVRRAGVGTILVHHMLDTLRSRGCIKINLQVRPTNKAVIAFYEALGFSVEERVSMGLLATNDAPQSAAADPNASPSSVG